VSAFAGLASAGNNLIIDDVIHHPDILRTVVQALQGMPVLFVGIRLPLDVAERREQERGNRVRGGTRAQPFNS